MNATQHLHAMGQSLWLDNLSIDHLASGALARYRDQYAVSGQNFNSSIYQLALATPNTGAWPDLPSQLGEHVPPLASKIYDALIRARAHHAKNAQALFVELLLFDLCQTAALFRPLHHATQGQDGWVSLEISPLLANDVIATMREVVHLYAQAGCNNLLIKIPFTNAGSKAIEACIYAGIPINITYLYSRAHYLAAAAAYMRGIERRIAEGLEPNVVSIASISVSRWDIAANSKVPAALRNQLGIANAHRVYSAHCDLHTSIRWRKLAAAGAKPQRLLWSSTGCKDPAVSATYYVDALAAAETINSMPEQTLFACAERTNPAPPMPSDGKEAERMLNEFALAGIDQDALAEQLQQDGLATFKNAWQDIMRLIAVKSTALADLPSM